MSDVTVPRLATHAALGSLAGAIWAGITGAIAIHAGAISGAAGGLVGSVVWHTFLRLSRHRRA